MSKKEKTSKQYYLSKKISSLDKNIFYEYLSIMLDGGVSITQAIKSAARRGRNPYFKKELQNMEVFLLSGDSLSKAMKKLPRIFSKFENSLVEAGEASGNVTDALENLAYIYEKKYLLRKKLIGALTYPFIIFLVLIAAVMVVMLMVIPQIRALFDDAGIELPLTTKALIATSDFFSNNIIILIFGLLVIWFFISLYKTTSRGKYDFEMLLFSTPLVGEVYKNYILAGISSNLGNLLGGGVSILKSLDLVGKATNSVVYGELFEKIGKKVSLGEKIVTSMREADPEEKFFPNDFLQILEVGEKTASMGKVSRKMVNQYEREVDFSLANLTKFIEPAMIAFAGIFVLWFAFSIFGAILKITDAVG